jgi:hypothetical protein
MIQIELIESLFFYLKRMDTTQLARRVLFVPCHNRVIPLSFLDMARHDTKKIKNKKNIRYGTV